MFWRRLYPLEKLAVVGGLGLVALVLFPMFARPRENDGHGRSCQSNLKQLGLGLLQYEQDYNEKFPPVAAGGSVYGWADAIFPYLKSNQIYQCPNEPTPGQTDPKQSGYTDYWFNARLSGRPIEGVGDTARLLAGGDGNDGTEVTDARYSLSHFPAKWMSDQNSPMFRHLGYANYLFADGHVKAFAPTGVATLWNATKPFLQPKAAP